MYLKNEKKRVRVVQFSFDTMRSDYEERLQQKDSDIESIKSEKEEALARAESAERELDEGREEMEKHQRFFPHRVLWLKSEMTPQNKITTFCWLNTYRKRIVSRKFGFYLSLDFGTYVDVLFQEDPDDQVL